MECHMSAASSAERRGGHRRQPTVGTICRMTSGAGPEPGIGLVWNLSQGGVSLLISRPIEPGTTVRGELMTLGGQQPVPVSFRVAHISKLMTGDYCIGAKFDRELGDHDLRRFLGDAAKPVK